jgi:DNA methylase
MTNTNVLTMLPIDQIRFVKELYPRLRQDDAAIERYRAALDRLPPVVVARGGVLVDGYHRWQAHKLEGATELQAEDLGNLTDAEILEESYRRNARHGQQLSKAEKIAAANRLYFSLDGREEERYATIADILSIRSSSARKYTAEARADEQRRKQERAWDLWLDCWTQQTIANELGESKQTINNWLSKRGTEFQDLTPSSLQTRDLWSFGNQENKRTEDGPFFGRLPRELVENLLWFYTEPGDIVVDPFAGSGTTIEVAKGIGRRIWASDLTPTGAFELTRIHPHDITTGWPAKAPAKTKLILLDPPYWKQARGRYSEGANDLGNMTLEQFYSAWEAIVRACVPHLSEGGRLAYVVSATQEDWKVVDHAMDMLRACWAVGLQVERRIIVPYQTEQVGVNHVRSARERRGLLHSYRDLVILAPA